MANAAETKAALLRALRSYQRAERASSCGAATNNLRIGQTWEQRAAQDMPAHLKKREFDALAPMQRELLQVQGQLAHRAYEAHLHRLQLCGISEMEHMRRAARDREPPDITRILDRRDRRRARKGSK